MTEEFITVPSDIEPSYKWSWPCDLDFS